MLYRRSAVAILLAVLVAWSNNRRFTYVIVHGAFGGGWSWREVDSIMSADGQKVFRPTLTGQGERVHLSSAGVTLDTHIQDIINTILYEDLHDVVLVGHSYGGMVITGVVDRIPDRIKSVIYLDAIVPEDGECANTAGGAFFHHITKLEPNAQGLIVPAWIKKNMSLPHDVPEPVGAFEQVIRLKNQAVTRAIPTAYILFLANGKEPKTADFSRFINARNLWDGEPKHLQAITTQSGRTRGNWPVCWKDCLNPIRFAAVFGILYCAGP